MRFDQQSAPNRDPSRTHNQFVDMPASFVLALLMIQQGEPQTFAAGVTAYTVQGSEQTIALGPVA